MGIWIALILILLLFCSIDLLVTDDDDDDEDVVLFWWDEYDPGEFLGWIALLLLAADFLVVLRAFIPIGLFILSWSRHILRRLDSTARLVSSLSLPKQKSRNKASANVTNTTSQVINSLDSHSFRQNEPTKKSKKITSHAAKLSNRRNICRDHDRMNKPIDKKALNTARKSAASKNKAIQPKNSPGLYSSHQNSTTSSSSSSSVTNKSIKQKLAISKSMRSRVPLQHLRLHRTQWKD